MNKKLLKVVVAIIVFIISMWALSNLMGSFKSIDRDGDGLSDDIEKKLGTNPLLSDSDGDGIDDGQEYQYWSDRSKNESNEQFAPDGEIDGDGAANMIDDDSDGDGISDGQELMDGTDPGKSDTDGDGIYDSSEQAMGTDPLNPDTDGDGIPDGRDNTPSGPQNPGDLTYGPVDPSERMGDPIRYGYGPKVVCFAVFNPSLVGKKRYQAFDAIRGDYKAYVADQTLYRVGLSDTRLANVFIGTITLNNIVYNEPIAIPSVAPNANIITYSTSDPYLTFDFYKDGADNFYVKSQYYNYVSNTVLVFTTSADSSYFTFDIPESLTLADIPSGIKHTPPSAVIAKANLIIDEIGLTGETNLKTIVNILYGYFSSFTAGDIPSEREEPDPYLAIARSKHGACYVRSFAFFVTANSMGLPTRLVVNECHAFVEIYIPTHGWMQLDLGGLGECETCNPGGYDPFTNFSGPNGNVPKPPPSQLSTTATISKLSSIAYKTGYFDVEGYVKDQNQKGVNGMSVEIFVFETKEIPVSRNDFRAGSGKTDGSGHFSVNCKVPDNIVAGTNQVLAHAIGNDTYDESWSDPAIDIYSNTTLSSTTVSSIGLGDELNITGNLLDASNKPLSGKSINIYWDGSYIGKTVTDEEGTFLFSYVPISLGKFAIRATFMEEKYLSSSSYDQNIILKDMSTSLDLTVAPTVTKREDQVNIQGKLSSKTEGAMSNSPIYVFCDSKQILNITTSLDGSFDEDFAIPKDSALGNITIKVHYPGDDIHAEANAEKIVFVRADTKLTLTSPNKKKIKQNETIVIGGTLADNIDQPLVNSSVKIYWDTYNKNLVTHANGTFNVNYTVSSTAPLAISTITAKFDGTAYYLASQDTTEVEIVTPDFIEGESQNKYIVPAIAVVVIIVILVVIIMLFKKRKIEAGPTIQEIASQTISKLKTEDDHRKTVINCYKQMCDWMSQKGIKKDSYQTPREFAMVSKGFLKMSPESLYVLTQIFEKARYSPHNISSDDRDKAIKCLSEILSAPVENIGSEKPREGPND